MLLICRLYALLCLGCALGTLVWAFSFLGGPGGLSGIDGMPRRGYAHALAGNLLLLAAFVVQHSLLARPWARRGLPRLLPGPLLRCSYVLLAALALALLLALWQPMGGLLWDLQACTAALLLQGLYLLGWALLVCGLVVLGPAEVFGLSQAWRARPNAWQSGPRASQLRCRAPTLFGAGALLVLFATPAMTSGRLLFALALGGYLLIAMQARRAAREAAESIPTP